jgi:predicted RNase H-like HicB family nuclease
MVMAPGRVRRGRQRPVLESQFMKLKVIIHKAEEGGFWAEAPGFPGCVSEGETLEEVRANIREALEGVLAVMQEQPPEEPEYAEGDVVEAVEV